MKECQKTPSLLIIFRNMLFYLFFTLFYSGISLLQAQSIDQKILDNNSKASAFMQEGKKTAAAQLYNESAYLLRNANRLSESAEYYQKVLDINSSLGNRRGQMFSHNSLAVVYLQMEDYTKALFHFTKELEFRKQINNKAEIINVLTNIAQTQKELSSFDAAVETIEEAIALSKELNDIQLLKRSYGIAFEIYEKKGDEKRARPYFELYSAIDKKLKEEKMAEIKTEANRIVTEANSEKQLTENQLSKTSEELKKTVNTLQEAEELTKEQQMELELRQSKINEQNALLETERLRRKYLSIGITILLSFVIILTLMILKIRSANKKINHQKYWLEKQNKEIKSSIEYAQTIQQAILPTNTEMERFFESFIIYMPKDIVSGDFYWFSDRSDDNRPTAYFSAVDCTGHGVPGAFMSMIGNRLLNDIVNEKNISSPAEILRLINLMIREALRQEQTDNNDGMDLALCKFERLSGNKTHLTFSGAKRPLYIIKNKENKIITHRGDRSSIGGYSLSKRTITFSNFEIDLEKGDVIYLFSDGIVDQHSPERKKFGRLRLEEALIDCAKLKPSEQKMIIEDRLLHFMQNEDQRDDIMLVGLKIV